jgi:hypothetical protein
VAVSGANPSVLRLAYTGSPSGGFGRARARDEFVENRDEPAAHVRGARGNSVSAEKDPPESVSSPNRAAARLAYTRRRLPIAQRRIAMGRARRHAGRDGNVNVAAAGALAVSSARRSQPEGPAKCNRRANPCGDQASDVT